MVPIFTISELQLIGNDPGYPIDETYVLQNDIDASDTVTWNGGLGFDPIALFEGEIDGAGFTISNLTINRPTSNNIGLINYSVGANFHDLDFVNADIRGDTYVSVLTSRSGTEITINNVNIQGTLHSGYYAGALIGSCSNKLEIQNCTIDINFVLPPTNNSSVGGLIGYISSSLALNSFIRNCSININTVTGLELDTFGGVVGSSYNLNEISGCSVEGDIVINDTTYYSAYYIGLLCGLAYNTDLISECQVEGSIYVNSITTISEIGGLIGDCSSSDVIEKCSAKVTIELITTTVICYVGGFFGYGSGVDVSDCYYASSGFTITGNNSTDTGGFVGMIDGNTIITNCYSATIMDFSGSAATADVGGLIGIIWGTYIPSNINSSYWDEELSGMSVSFAGEGKTTAEMKAQATFIGWDFGTTWFILEGVIYPQFEEIIPPDDDTPLPEICPDICYFGDIRLVPFEGITDLTNLQMCDREIRRDPTLETSILISLFTNRRADEDDLLPDNSDEKYGFWGDVLNADINDSYGSKLWLLGREKSTNNLLRQAEDYINEALEWMIEDGVATLINTVVSFYDEKTLSISLTITQSNTTDELFYKYFYNWKAQVLREV